MILLVVILVSGAVAKFDLVIANSSTLLFEQIKYGIYLISILLLIEYFCLAVYFSRKRSQTGNSFDDIGKFFIQGIRTMIDFWVIYTIVRGGEYFFSDVIVWIEIYNLNLMLGLCVSTLVLVLFIIDIVANAFPIPKIAKWPLIQRLPGNIVIRVLAMNMNQRHKDAVLAAEMYAWAWRDSTPPSQAELEYSPLWED